MQLTAVIALFGDMMSFQTEQRLDENPRPEC